MGERPKFKMEICDTFFIASMGTIITGQIHEGQISIGDKVELLNVQGLFTGNAVVTDIQQLQKHLTIAYVGDNIGLVLSGVDKSICLNSKIVISRSDKEIIDYFSFILNA